MAYPGVDRIELPLLQELVATGGVDDVHFLYDRLVAYFPQLDEADVRALADGHRLQWRRIVQRAGRALEEKRQIERRRGRWTITTAGRRRVTEEDLHFDFSEEAAREPASPVEATHADVQQMLIEVGRILGYHAQSEFDYYDVVWREGAESPRLSHVFEVQHRGNVDAALAKLKRAYDAQRTRPFLVVSSERDTNRAEMQMSLARTGAFHEIGSVTTILSFEQLRRLHRALTSVEDILPLISAR